MKNEKPTWIFLYIKYRKFWSISLEHFVERKPISEESLHISQWWFNVMIWSIWQIISQLHKCFLPNEMQQCAKTVSRHLECLTCFLRTFMSRVLKLASSSSAQCSYIWQKKITIWIWKGAWLFRRGLWFWPLI